MSFALVKGDITKIKCDAVVNASNVNLYPGGGVDRAIHVAAGPELRKACNEIGGVVTGKAVITPGFNLPARFVIHTAGPIWRGGKYGERQLLASCYMSCLELAAENGCESVAFPLISAGIYGYPAAEAFEVASETVRKFLEDNEMEVSMVIFDGSLSLITEKEKDSISLFISETLEPDMICAPGKAAYSGRVNAARKMRTVKSKPSKVGNSFGKSAIKPDNLMYERDEAPKPCFAETAFEECEAAHEMNLEDMLKNMDESFPVTLMKLIDKKNMTDVGCYKKANVSKQTWYKIMNDRSYKPSKNTVISFAIALELSFEETQALLGTVGFTLSRSSISDVIIEYFLKNGEYDIMKIDEALFKFDQVTLGSQA